MAGRTGAGAAAIGFDPGDIVVACAFHDRQTIGDLYDMFRAVMFDIGDFRHANLLPFTNFLSAT